MPQPLRFLRALYVQVLIGAMLGISIGYIEPSWGVALKALADGFIKLLRVVVAPIIFTIVVTGIAKMTDLKSLGRVGVKTVIYFEIMTSLALAIGLIVSNLVRPGDGMNIDPKSLDASSVAGFANTAHSQNITDFFLRLIPDNFIDAFTKTDILPVVLLATLVGVAVSHLGSRASGFANVVEQASEVLFTIVGYMMRLAPLAALGAMAFTIGQYGISSLIPYARLMIAFYVTCFVFIGLILGLVMRVCGLNLWHFLVYLRDELLITLGAASTEPAMPKLIQKLEAMGCDRSVVGLVVPTGYAFNVDGVCIYLTMAVIFLAQAMNVNLSIQQQIVMLLIASFTSKGTSGVPGAGFVALAGTLASVSTLPVAALGLLLGVDRFMGEARALTSIIGNAVATVAVAHWEGKLDQVKAKAVLSYGAPLILAELAGDEPKLAI